MGPADIEFMAKKRKTERIAGKPAEITNGVDNRISRKSKEDRTGTVVQSVKGDEDRVSPYDKKQSGPAKKKAKTKYSGTEPPIPPPVLFDLIHNFLKGGT